MPHSLIISDLHLCESHPHTTERFLSFIQEIAPKAETLYVLGDLFEYWAGDDDLDTPFHRRISSEFANLVKGGTPLFIMHGNRDFLIKQSMTHACRATLLSDPTLLELYGQPTLLTHGDDLCTGDVEYQNVRKMLRSDEWQSQFLSQPLSQRKAAIEQARVNSEQSKRTMSADIMDVSNDAVHDLLRQYDFPRLIHGHTHRPATHIHHIDGHTCERWVLGDWDTQANALQLDDAGIRYLKFS